jgi:regulator of ribonuclease activity A
MTESSGTILAGEGRRRHPVTANLVDAHESTLRCCEVQFRQFGGVLRFGGPVRTIKCFEDNTLIKQALSEPGKGAVLVVDGGGSVRTSLLGDYLAGLGVKNGWNGLVIWGAVRDTVALGQLAFGVKALGANPWRSSKTGSGQRDVPVAFGGMVFRPNDWLYSDEDGIVVSERPLEA